MFGTMLNLRTCPVCNSGNTNYYTSTSAQMHSNKEVFGFDQCKDCEFVFMNPRVPTEQLKNYYTKYYLPYRGAEAWGKFEKLVENSFKKLDSRKLKRLNKVHKLTPSSVILDIGCGQPSFLKMCKDQTNCQTHGIDFSNEGWLHQSLKYEGLNLQIGEICDLSKELKPDVITMWHYLEHDYTPSYNLNYLKSISKPTTKLIIEVPNFESSSRRKFGKNWAGWHTPRHASLFSPKNLELMLNRNGWKVDQSFNYGTMDPYLIHWMSKMEEKGIAWNKSMEGEILPFISGMLRFIPKKLLEKKLSLGIMTTVASLS
ncbi:class I SAM-dependent methyltransferase [Psychroflexus sp. CAK1W]|uniref:class I SAM-dependent methyltransferase n=1 Tax=Psychroflexus curvus TaxID=2873595 RepID=UPI001CCFDF87|nr:class I SAM-dependent methyltransferase [Psychroflexus curvus]MBZ9629116.1 class I SAM-dependent methyltransferase [Psychroflexus curvus]